MLKKSCLLILVSWCMLFTSCEEDVFTVAQETERVPDTISHIVMWGNKMDTAYLFTTYLDPGSEIHGNEALNDCSHAKAEVSGTVNTRIPGTYYLYYDATDKAGHAAKTLTRTVQVVENDAGFLNGTYDVVCTCTVTTRGANKQTLSATNYTATIFPEKRNGQFRLVPMHLGAEYVVPNSQLSGDSMYLGYFSPDYYTLDITSKLSATKTTFTTESTALKYSPALTYRCKNIFTKQFVLSPKTVTN